jgi:hypothetical protein
MQYQGLVHQQTVSAGSKSEHRAVVLQTDEGPLKLRREGGNPFQDEILQKLVGKRITCEGQVHSGQLIMSNWEVDDTQTG